MAYVVQRVTLMNHDATGRASVVLVQITNQATFTECMQAFCDGGGINEVARTQCTRNVIIDRPQTNSPLHHGVRNADILFVREKSRTIFLAKKSKFSSQVFSLVDRHRSLENIKNILDEGKTITPDGHVLYCWQSPTF